MIAEDVVALLEDSACMEESRGCKTWIYQYQTEKSHLLQII